MPRVLVVTHNWLPSFDSQVKRVANLLRYLPGTGWSPHVLTDASGQDAMQLSDDEISRSPALKAVAEFPIARTPSAMEDAGLAAVRQFGIGAVLSMCPPFPTHEAAGEIARRAGVPWVALLDDLDALYVGPADGRSMMERRRASTRARTSLRDVWRVAAGTPRTLAHLRESFGVEGDIVMPAFDPEDRRVAPHREQGAPLRIVHAGPLDRVTQAPLALFDGLDALLAEQPAGRVRLDIVGSGIEPFLRARLEGRACAGSVHIVERLEPNELLRLQRESDLLVALQRTDAVALALGGTTRAPAEVVELLPAARPIVLVGDDETSMDWEIIRNAGVGTQASDAIELAAVLSRFLAELESAGAIAYAGDDAAVAKLSATEQVKRVAALLDAASAERFGSWQRARQ